MYVQALIAVAKKKSSADGAVPAFYATTAYKQWARAKWEGKGWSLEELARRIKRINPAANASDGGLSQFFGPKNNPAPPSNVTFMPELNKLFGAAPPPVCDPTSSFAQIRDHFEAKWNSLTPKEQLMVFAAFGIDPPPKGSGS